MRIDKRKLEMCRARKCLTIANMLKAAGLSRGVLKSLGTDNTSPASVGKLAKALECDIEDIISDNSR